MDRKKIELIAAGTLIFVFLILLGKVFLSPKKEELIQNNFTNPQVKKEEPKPDFKLLEKKFQGLKWERNPFKISYLTPTQSAGASSHLLKGTICSEGASLAIFGEDSFSVGDTISRYRVLQIEKDHVILSDGDNTYKLSVGQSLDVFD